MPIFCNNCGRENKDTATFCSGCGSGLQQPSSPSGPLTAGTVLENRYKIVTLIKSGGMGAVYKAVDDKLDRICAVKELLPPYGTPQQQVQAAEWFKREAKLLANLDHAYLPEVIDYFVAQCKYYLVMSFIEGEDLDTKLQKEGTPGLLEDDVIDWIKQVLQVLDYLHSQNPPVVYRDIKPANIMLHRDGRVFLIDFGIARVVQEASQTKKTAIGTQGYAPPEQIRGQVEPRSDIYALGATMHHLLTGIEPVGPMMFESLKRIVPSISTTVDNVVTKALEIKVENRYTDAKEMLSALASAPSVVSQPQVMSSLQFKQQQIVDQKKQEERVFIVKDNNINTETPKIPELSKKKVVFHEDDKIKITSSEIAIKNFSSSYDNKTYKLTDITHINNKTDRSGTSYSCLVFFIPFLIFPLYLLFLSQSGESFNGICCFLGMISAPLLGVLLAFQTEKAVKPFILILKTNSGELIELRDGNKLYIRDIVKELKNANKYSNANIIIHYSFFA